MVTINLNLGNKIFYSMLIFGVLLLVAGIAYAGYDSNIHGHEGLCLEGTCVNTWVDLEAMITQSPSGTIAYINPGLNKDNRVCKDNEENILECNPTGESSDCWCLLKGTNDKKRKAISMEFCKALEKNFISYAIADVKNSEKQIRKKCDGWEIAIDGSCEKEIVETGLKNTGYISRIVCG